MTRPSTFAAHLNRRVTIAGITALVVVAVIVTLAVQRASGNDNGNGIAGAPAFSAAQLAARPGANWITNGGSLANDRYSPLGQINTGNVAKLKGIWHIHLKSGIAKQYSAEAQPLVYQGVIYTTTGADDVFAIDAHTGKIKWTYRAHLNPKISTICCGWDNRGVALGDGKVYLGRLDGKLVALDQKTGKVDWSTQLGRWQDGATITNAPLYYDGRIYTGLSGGEYLIRGRLTAFSAKTGKELWRFYTVPGPGQTGHDTWPASGTAYLHGGGPVWQTPAVDPSLGLVYFATGNAAPDIDGRGRAGDNLFTSSIVALNATTGAYRWHFQEVHHDLWDYDATSPVVLFSATVNGTVHPAIAEPGKTGWLYMLDRATGKPLFDIPEKAVPQSALENTSPTQPFPSNPPFISHTVSKAQLAAIHAAAAATSPAGEVPKIVASPIFTPPGTGSSIPAVAPGPQGGTNWPTTSYNPHTKMLYVCAQNGASAYLYGTHEPKVPKSGEADFGSIPAATGFGKNAGTLTAIEANSGKIAWQNHWTTSCYSGSTTTGGNLVFSGRNDGQLQAFNATTGKQLWSFQTGAGANSTPTVFNMDGQEVAVFYAGGNSLAGTAHGDNLWLFGLNGKLGPVAPGAAEGATTHAGEATGTSRTIQVQGGEFFFKLSSQSAPKGKVTFVFKNVGHVQHDFAIDGKITKLIGPGQKATVVVNLAKAGQYPYLCTVPGHAAAGMKGTFKAT